MSIETISAIIGLLLTLMVFSYLIGDSPFFRIAINIFVGVASGYAVTVILYYVLMPRLSDLLRLNNPINPIQLIVTAVAFILGSTLFAKLFPRTAWIGNFAMAILVGVGAATAIGGALIGSLIPQIQAAIGAFDSHSATAISKGWYYALIEGTIMFLGTVLTLAAFHFSAGRAADGTPKRMPLIEGAAWFGRAFIAVTLGALFAGVYMASLTAMIERLRFIIIDVPSVLRQLIGI